MRRFLIISILISLFFSPIRSFSLADPAALPLQGVRYFLNYTTHDYGAQPQNWAIVQDNQGIIYVANHGGVLQYDGISWRIIKIPNWSARSLACTDSGVLYIGGKNECGFLAPDDRGELNYVSLVPYLQAQQKNFADVWNTHATTGGIYFETAQFLFCWDPQKKKMKVWEPGYLFNNTFACNKEFFVHSRQVGLLHIKDDSWQLVPGGEILAGKKVFFMAPLDAAAQKLLIGTRDHGFFLYDHRTVVPYPTEAQGYLEGKKLYQGIRLHDGNFALATLSGGLVIMDARGNMLRVIDKSAGLQDNNVKHVFQDREENLWLGLENGISKIEYGSPLACFNEFSGLMGPVFSVVKCRSNLFVGTTAGLFHSAGTGRFLPVPRISERCLGLLAINKDILAATAAGIWVIQIQENNTLQVKGPLVDATSYVLQPSLENGARVWAGTNEGLMSLILSGPPGKGQWGLEQRFKNISLPIHTIVEDAGGALWLGTLSQGAMSVEFPTGIPYPVVTRFDRSHGLPSEEVHVFMAAGHVIFATAKGIYRYDGQNRVFVPDKTFGQAFADGSRSVFRLAQDSRGQVWLHSNVRNFQAVPQPGRSFSILAAPFLRMPVEQVNAIYPDPDGQIVWFAAVNGLIAYDTGIKKDYEKSNFVALIREVRLIDRNLPLFLGSPAALPPVFPYKHHNLRFRFAAPFFQDEKSITFRVFLEGYDREWSEWSRETQKDYTNLDGGKYTFRVQAKNVFDHLSREGHYPFQVLPPWFKTWWAFSLYGIAVLACLFLLVRLRSWKLVQENYRLEGIIGDRTKEVLGKNRQLEEQTQQLQEQSVKLKELDRVKSRFFANISHEFRTPLTLIMGPLEQILATPEPPAPAELESKAKLMLRHSQRLLHLVNQLLDLSHLESGKMKLQVARQDIVAFLRMIIASFQSLAQQQKLELTLLAEPGELPVYFDADKLEKAMGNLLSNAVKFTPAGGRVTVAVKKGLAEETLFPHGYLEISVCDTGIGIPADQVAHVFQRFYQAHSGHEYRQKGTGIGLALTKELILLHGGDIRVRSRTAPGEQTPGSEFILRLPLGKGHWRAGEIVDVSGTDVSPVPPPMPGLWPGADEQEEPGPRTPVPGQEVILVVEDSGDMRHYIREALADGYQVVETVDGLQGMAKAREIIPDLIVSDIMMPGADGYELCAQLKKDIRTSHIPIILLTARSNEESVIEGLQTGADDYITKPFNTRVLIARIKNLIELRRQLQRKRQRQMTMQPQEIVVTSIDETFYKEVQDTIEKNLSDPEFNVEQMSKKLYMSRTSLYMKILALTGETPTQFIRSYRLKRAAQLLQANFGNVTEVAFAVGFSSTAYFTKCFKEMFQQLPSSYHASESGGG